MKKYIASIFFFCAVVTTSSAQQKFPAVDKSPMDMSYYPNGYPLQKIQGKITESATCRVVYSRPQRNGRSIFGEVLEYGKVWRMGANEATEIEFFKTVHIGGKKVKKGRYTMYCIPYADKWTIIINKETDTWGSFTYDEKKDLLRTDVAVQKQTEIVESFSMMFEKSATGCSLLIAWDDEKVSLPITF
jgi:hypothetical protein